MKCVVCGERKGKRACPAKGSAICAQCCGEKRLLEIDCPETCEYLKAGQERDARRPQWGPAEAARLQKYRGVIAENEDFLAHIEYTIGKQRRSSRDLKDKHVAEALDLLLRTLRSEESGVLYEQTSDDLMVESLRRQLRDLVESHRRPAAQDSDPYALSAPPVSRLKLGTAIECLEFIRELVRAHIEHERSVPAYLDVLVRTMVGRSVRESGPSIIIPGR